MLINIKGTPTGIGNQKVIKPPTKDKLASPSDKYLIKTEMGYDMGHKKWPTLNK
jgi:hypothetical protein